MDTKTARIRALNDELRQHLDRRPRRDHAGRGRTRPSRRRPHRQDDRRVRRFLSGQRPVRGA